MRPRLGILAGGGNLPARVIDACRRAGREFFVIAFEGQADAATVETTPHAWVPLGAAGKTIALLHQADVTEVMMVGRIRRPSLKSLHPDLRAAKILARVGARVGGDDALLSGITAELETEGFRVIGPDHILDDLLAGIGVHGAIEPGDEARCDIGRGVEVLRGLGHLDIGQAVVVQQGVVLGVEAAEGTDALIARCGPLHGDGPGGVLVKISKPGQERRVDLPTIGVATVEAAAAAGLRGIAVEAGGALLVDREATVEAADRAGLFVVGIDVPE
jgi:UDP-2,3-diacylglucosamine hydrolase